MAEDASHANGQDPAAEAPPTPPPTPDPVPVPLEDVRAAHAARQISNADMRKAEAGGTVEIPAETPAAEETPPPPVTEQRKPTREEALAVLADDANLSHDDLKGLKAYNDTLNKAISQSKAEQAKATALGEWSAFFEKLTPEQLTSVQRDDALAQQATQGRMSAAQMRHVFDQVETWRTSGQMMRSGAYKQAADVIHKEIATSLSEMTDYPALAKRMPQLEEQAAGSGAKLFSLAVEVAAADRIEAATKAIEAKWEAKFNERAAEFHNGQGSPDRLNGGIAGGGKGYSTLEEAQAAHAHREIDNNTFRRYQAAFAK